MSERLDIEGMLGSIYVDSIDIIRYQTDSLFYYKNSDDKTMTSMTVTLVIAIHFHFLNIKNIFIPSYSVFYVYFCFR